NICRRSEPLYDPTVLVPNRSAFEEKPSVIAIGASDATLQGKRLGCLYGVHPTIKDNLRILRVQRGDPAALGSLTCSQTCVPGPRPADIIPPAVRARGEDNLRQVFHQAMIAFVTLANGGLELFRSRQVDQDAPHSLAFFGKVDDLSRAQQP